jgi:dihydropteroate synthase
MFNCIAELGIPYIMMHMQGSPQTMQNKPIYNSLVNDIITNLSKKIFRARELGIIDIVIDPGFGFGKTLEHNYQILNDLSFFKELDCPILVGISRKSMIYKLLNNDPKNALNGTSCLNTVALSKGANILRVHDVKEAKEIIKLTNFLISSS